MPATLAVLGVELHQIHDAFSGAGSIEVADFRPCVDVHVHGDVTTIGGTGAVGGAAAGVDSGAAAARIAAQQGEKDQWEWSGGNKIDVTIADGATSVEIVVRAVPRSPDGTPRRIVLGCVSLRLNTLSTSSKTRRWYTLASNLESESTLPAYLEEGAGTILPASPRGVLEMSLMYRIGEGASSASDIESDSFAEKEKRESTGSVGRRANPALHEALPCRLIDYCVVIGPKIVEPKEEGGDDVVVPSIMFQCPQESHADLPLPEKLDWFAFPSGYKTFAASSTSRNLLPRTFTFVLTQSNIRVYGICLTSCEFASPNKGIQLEAVTPPSSSAKRRVRRRSSFARMLGRDPRALQTGRRIQHCWAPSCVIFLTRFPFIPQLAECLHEFHLLRRRQGGCGGAGGEHPPWHTLAQ
jgi:hypothetical protein